MSNSHSEETAEHNQNPTWRELVQPRTVPLLVLLVLQLLLNVSIATFFEVKDGEIAAPVIGLVFSQIVLFAIWCTLVPIHFGTRFLVGTAAFVFTAICMYRCAQRDGGGDTIAVTVTGAMFVQWLLYQMPLWHTRWKGWHLSMRESGPSEQPANELQFGIAQLFLWTTLVAVFLGALRILFTVFGDGIRGGSLDLNLFPAMALANTLLVLPLIYACFSRNNMPLWMGIAIGWAIMVTFAQRIFLGTSGGPDLWFFVLINIGQFVAVLTTLLFTRLAGVRLQNATSDS